MIRHLLLLVATSCISFMLPGQNEPVNRQNYKLHINETASEIVIDGLLKETVWSEAEVAKQFHLITPIDTGYARARTEVMMTYDQTNIYMAIICYDPWPGKRPVESLRRDFSFGANENFLAFIDTYNDQTNGFSFGVSAAGAQWDGLQANGGFVSLDWDCKWRSEVKNYPDRWEAEFAIPFRSIRYREGITEWGINFSRLDLKGNEKSGWAPVPRQFQSANLAFTGTLVWDKPPPNLGTRFSLIPYVSARGSQDVEANESMKFSADAGLDAKVTLSTSMNLDLTINPDFSQVEVDRQVTNLDRFELFFPERRQFFLENSDQFASLGAESIRPFFSRRIGLDSPVRAGARLSGQLSEKWRLGLMNMQTGSQDSIPASNFTVAALRKQIFARSNIGFFLVNKQVTADKETYNFIGPRYNRVAGMDVNLASADNRWTGKAFYHQSFYSGASGETFALAGEVNYSTQQFEATWNQAWVGADYRAEAGFVRRTGFHQINPSVEYKFFPASSKIISHGPEMEIDLFYDPNFSLTDREIDLSYEVRWLNRSDLSLDLEEAFVKLQAPFDPTNSGGDTLATGSEFNWTEVALTYDSDNRKLFNYQISGRYGGFFNGERLNFNGTFNYRVQPYGNFGLDVSFNRVTLPEPFKSADFWLIGPRLDLTFTDKLFFTTFVQYNEQRDNLNLNMRFQWRFAPVSDLFIVYTDNSFPENLQTKNRALVVKLSYWLN